MQIRRPMFQPTGPVGIFMDQDAAIIQAGHQLDRGGAVFNVRHPSFGAIGDGVTDDTVAIQAALSAAQDVNGVVLVPDGVFVCRQLNVTRACALVGAGWLVSRLKLAAAADQESNLLLVDRPPQFSMANLTLDGNRANQDQQSDDDFQNCAWILSGDLRITRCAFTGAARNGLVVTDASIEGSGPPQGPNYHGIMDSFFVGNGNQGFRVKNFSAGHVIGNQFLNNDGSGLHIASADRNSFIGNQYYNNQGDACDVRNVQRCTFVGESYDRCRNHLLSIAGKAFGNMFIGCNFTTPGQSEFGDDATNTWDCINVINVGAEVPRDCLIIGCNIEAGIDNPSVKGRHALNIAHGGVTGVRLVDCHIDPSGFASSLLAFTGNAIQDNAVSLAARLSSPSALANGNSNDYDPGVATTLRISADGGAGGSTLTGLTGVAPGRRLRLICIAGAQLVLAHQNAGSAAGNRLLSPSGANVTLNVDDSADVEYDGSTQRWRITGVAT